MKPPDNDADKKAEGFARQFAMATELPLLFVGAIVIGGLLGFFLDRWLHTKPWLMIVGGGLGFAAGLRDMLKRLASNDDK
ncbi:MAG: AtpZ/AtpI family protein [Candidatus Acidiferrales bacterium]